MTILIRVIKESLEVSATNLLSAALMSEYHPGFSVL